MRSRRQTVGVKPSGPPADLMRLGTLALATALLLPAMAGCVDPSAAPAGPVTFETIEQGQQSGIEERRTVVVRNQSAFQTLWLEHKSDAEGDPGIPDVDFDKRMVVAVFKGQSPDGCHGAEITNITGENGTLVVEGEWFNVDAAACTAQVTYPFHVVELDRAEVPVEFSMEETSRKAGPPPEESKNESSGDDGTAGQSPEPEEGTYACRERSSDEATPEEASNVSFEDVDHGQQSGIEEVCLTVARNETAWRDLWADHQNGSQPGEERPAVNFSEHLVVAIFKGQSPDGCHGAKIENLAANGSTLHVEGVFAKTEGGYCTEAITYPFHMVKADRHEQVRFHVEETTREAD